MIGKTQTLIALMGLLALAAVPTASQIAPSAAKEWNVNNTDNMSPATEYELYNTSGGQIGYENRRVGVNLGWVGHGGGWFEFLRKSPPGVRDHRGPIASDENVALYNTKTRRYLMYYDRADTKAEVEWSSTPIYEWLIQDQSASGGRVHFALFNNRVKKYLIYKVQNYGINLGWLNESSPPPQSFSVAMSAQQINQGWVPYLGSFGQNTRGNLLTAQNASQSATLLFVKPGKSTTDCADPNATLRVAPHAMMTADQMKILYSSATPRLPIKFLACLTTPASQSISLTYVNITYKLDP